MTTKYRLYSCIAPLCVVKWCVIFVTNVSQYNDVIKSAMASQTTGVSIVYSTICSGVDQRKHQSSASLAFVRGIHRCPVNSPHKGPVTRKMFPFVDVIMQCFMMVYDLAILYALNPSWAMLSLVYDIMLFITTWSRWTNGDNAVPIT